MQRKTSICVDSTWVIWYEKRTDKKKRTENREVNSSAVVTGIIQQDVSDFLIKKNPFTQLTEKNQFISDHWAKQMHEELSWRLLLNFDSQT